MSGFSPFRTRLRWTLSMYLDLTTRVFAALTFWCSRCSRNKEAPSTEETMPRVPKMRSTRLFHSYGSCFHGYQKLGCATTSTRIWLGTHRKWSKGLREAWTTPSSVCSKPSWRISLRCSRQLRNTGARPGWQGKYPAVSGWPSTFWAATKLRFPLIPSGMNSHRSHAS